MDLIDREQALGCFWVYEDGDETEMPAYDRLQALPIVAEVEDCISREAAIAYSISGMTREIDGDKWIRVSEVRESIKTMPSAQPETEERTAESAQNVTNGELISKKAAIDALWKALYEYEDKTEKQFQESEDLDVADWILHRIFVQNMNDIDRQTILALPSAEPDERMLHESCTDCPLYDKDRHSCPRFNKVIPETLREVMAERRQDEQTD